MISWVHPALLWGGLAALVPVLIHLLLRPRPRRLRFPALALLHGALVSGQRANRVRNLLLLAVRALLAALTAALLAGPTCTSAADPASTVTPIACAIILDDSLSMRYRPRFDTETTLLDQARSAARAYVEDARAWPPGSEVAVLHAGTADGTPLNADRTAATAALLAADSGIPSCRALGAALSAVAERLRAAPGRVPQVVVFTDGTAAAWRDVQPGLFSGLDGLRVRVVTTVAGQQANLGLQTASTPARVHAATASVRLRVLIDVHGGASECRIVARDGERVLARWGPEMVAANTQREVTLALPPSSPGPHAATLELEPVDLWPADQQCYVTWETAPPPEAWLLASPATDPERDLSLVIMRNLLAPQALRPEEQRLQVALPQAPDIEQRLARSSTASSARVPALVVMFPGLELPAATQSSLRRLVETGTTLLLAPDSTTRSPDWPGWRALFADAPPTSEAAPDGTTIRWSTPAGRDELHQALREIERCPIGQRLRFDPLRTGVTTLANYGDGVPALFSVPLGTGRVIALTTSPDPHWSELGARAAGLLTWLHMLVDEAVGPPRAVAQLVVGQAVRTPFAALPVSGSVAVTALTEAQRKSMSLRLDEGIPAKGWPTEAPGVYGVRAGTANDHMALYAVNWPAAELDLRPVTRAELVAALGTDAVVLESPTGADAGASSSWWRRLCARIEPTAALGMMLAALAGVELLLAGRPRRA